jgi:hypothetical protein
MPVYACIPSQLSVAHSNIHAPPIVYAANWVFYSHMTCASVTHAEPQRRPPQLGFPAVSSHLSFMMVND